MYILGKGKKKAFRKIFHVVCFFFISTLDIIFMCKNTAYMLTMKRNTLFKFL